jgi:hypothetical protein
MMDGGCIIMWCAVYSLFGSIYEVIHLSMSEVCVLANIVLNFVVHYAGKKVQRRAARLARNRAAAISTRGAEGSGDKTHPFISDGQPVLSYQEALLRGRDDGGSGKKEEKKKEEDEEDENGRESEGSDGEDEDDEDEDEDEEGTAGGGRTSASKSTSFSGAGSLGGSFLDAMDGTSGGADDINFGIQVNTHTAPAIPRPPSF